MTEEFGDTKKVVIAGNTTMVHLLMGYSCGTLGEYPFKSKHLGTLKTTLDKVTKVRFRRLKQLYMAVYLRLWAAI